MRALSNLLTWLYARGRDLHRSRTQARALPFPLISVGNIASGGRGKSPFVIYLCQELRRRGFFPVVLTRGYRREGRFPVWLEDKKNLPKVESCGDEAMETFLETEVPVLVSSHRFENAMNYLKARPDKKPLFILDDGFQHWGLKRNLDIVLVDSRDFKDELLPVGRLREKPEALGRAQIVLKRNEDYFKETELQYRPPREALLLTSRALDPAYQEFFSRKGLKLQVRALGDHASAPTMKRAIKKSGLKDVLVGGKEAVKLLSPEQYLELRRKGTYSLGELNLYFVSLTLKFRSEEEIWQKILRNLVGPAGAP